MIFSFLDSNLKELKKLQKHLMQILSFENEVSNKTQDELISKTKNWQQEFSELTYEKKQEKLIQILPEAFAMVREASFRTIGKKHYDVQLMAGTALHFGKIAEQKTGEGKTLTATCPLFLNSLTGDGVHLVTANDYLAKHGCGWMAPIYNYLGLEVGVISSDGAFKYDPEYNNENEPDEYVKKLKPCSKKEAYQCDITYGTNHEFGFDYLRDNMVMSLNQKSQTSPLGDLGIHNFAIVDEVDFVLIDVARTPLIISAPDAKPTDRYHLASKMVGSLINKSDYDLEEKHKNVTLTDMGIRKIERSLGISNLYEQDFEMVHLIEQALKANTLFEKNKDYIVKDGKVIIVDQFTGRLLPDNRFADGLHQALEAKEKCAIQQESKTLAEISYQNYFRLYKKLSGMTGTAETESIEFKKIYNLDVVIIPTNNKVVRKDHPDVIYKTEVGKFKAVADEIVEKHKKGQPVLVGTVSVEKSELLHELLKRRGVPHEILNAKNHEKEASIIAQAGRLGAVTVSTNMAGRGVDILLGGDPDTKEEKEKVKSLGGLCVIGTERHESRRIDNQLRGRAGRQGDIGESRFYISMQDSLMRIFGGSQIEGIMNTLGIDDSVPVASGIVSKSIERAQKRVESFNFDRRKQVVEMDDVMNVHRQVVYKLRDKVLNSAFYGNNEEWIIEKLKKNGGLTLPDDLIKIKGSLDNSELLKFLAQVMVPIIDSHWIEHLVAMNQVRDGIGLKGYAQRDPMVEYKREGHERFEVLINKIYTETVNRIRNIQDIQKVEAKEVINPQKVVYNQDDYSQSSDEVKKSLKPKTVVLDQESKLGRNDPCFCGSGKKYKNCHGKS